MNPLRYAREAWRLYNTDDRRETYIAFVLALVALYPLLLTLYRQRSRSD